MEFNDINSPKYTARHCGHDYLITIDSVKVEMVEQPITERGRKENNNNNSVSEENEKPKAILMAEYLKNNNNSCLTSDHFHPWWHDNGYGNFTWVWMAASLQAHKNMQFITGVTAAVYSTIRLSLRKHLLHLTYYILVE